LPSKMRLFAGSTKVAIGQIFPVMESPQYTRAFGGNDATSLVSVCSFTGR
jgi:hypothetical protein